MEPLTVHVYDASTGRHLCRLPYTSVSWSESLNEPGSMSVDIDYSQDAVALGLFDRLRLWGVLVGVKRGSGIIHAGPLTDYRWDAGSRRLSLTVGGGQTLLTKRLVLDHRLKDHWRDGEILADEDHPPGLMRLHCEGSWPDIVRALVREATLWSPLPFDLPAAQGGSASRDYYAWDAATVSDRIDDVTGLADGPDVRFDPVEQPEGSLRFRLRCEAGICDHTWAWNAMVPGQRVVLDGVDGSGAGMANHCYAVGGKDTDRVAMARRWRLLGEGEALLMVADTSHTTDSDIKSLQGYALSDLSAGSWPAVTYRLKVGGEHDVRVGDRADVRVEDDFLGERVLGLRITDVSGSADSDWLDVQAGER